MLPECIFMNVYFVRSNIRGGNRREGFSVTADRQ